MTHGIFRSKAQCFNCGFTDFYFFPKGAILIDYEEDTDQPSCYRMENYDNHKSISCHNCGLARLKVLYWNYEVEDPIHHKEGGGEENGLSNSPR